MSHYIWKTVPDTDEKLPCIVYISVLWCSFQMVNGWAGWFCLRVQKEEAEDPTTDFALMTKCKRVIKVKVLFPLFVYS